MICMYVPHPLCNPKLPLASHQSTHEILKSTVVYHTYVLAQARAREVGG